MSHQFLRTTPRRGATLALLGVALALAGCTGVATRLQPPAASIQQLTVQSDGTWVALVRVQNNSYDTGMHVHAIDLTLSLDGRPAGHIAVSPSLDIPAMDADVATSTFEPDAAGVSALGAARPNAIAYELKGTLSVGKDSKSKAQSFPVDDKGFISPVPGVSNIWR